MTALATHRKGLTFNELKTFCALTDGNLNRHLQVLVESKLVVVTKLSGGSRTQTWCRITAIGSKRYVHYLAVLEQLIKDASARDQTGPLIDGPPAST